jgi:hypothetical protein
MAPSIDGNGSNPYVWRRNSSYAHRITRVAISAHERRRSRLRNQRVLQARDAVDGVKELGVKSGRDELLADVESWRDICARILIVRSPWSGVRVL